MLPLIIVARNFKFQVPHPYEDSTFEGKSDPRNVIGTIGNLGHAHGDLGMA